MLGEKLMRLRRKQGLSQQEVADLLGVTRQTISNWECGQGSPALDKAAELARLYHLGLDDLVADEVEVVMASESAPKDLHVARTLVGKTCKIAFTDEMLMLTVGSNDPLMTVLDVSDQWLRVEYERTNAMLKKETVVQLIDIDAIGSIRICGDAS